MSSRVTRDHHSLTRNLKLNGKYISNDGGDEGISISDSGHVTNTGKLLIDYDSNTPANGVYNSLEIDTDIEGAQSNSVSHSPLSSVFTSTEATGGFQTLIGLNSNITQQMAADSGFNYAFGIVNSVTGSSNGTSWCAGITNTISGFDNAIGISQIVGGGSGTVGFQQNVTDGEIDIKLLSSADTGDYFSISTGANAATTIATVDDDNNEAAHLTFDIQGDTIFKGDIADGTSTEICRMDASASALTLPANIKLMLGAAGEYIVGDGTDMVMASSGAMLITTSVSSGTGVLSLSSGAEMTLGSDTGVFNFQDDGDADDAFKITVAGGTGATTLETLSDAADGHMTLNADGDLTLDCGRLNLDGSTVTNFIKNGTTFGIFDAGDSTTTFTLYEAGGSSTDDRFTIDVGAAGATTISTVDADVNAANLTFQIDGDTIIDNNVSNTSTGTYTGLYVDMDKTGASTTDNTVYGLKCMVDSMQSTDGANTMYGIYTANRFRHAADAGTITGYGAYIEAAGSSNGTSKMIGAFIGANNADTNIGILIECTDGGEDIKIASTANASDYFTIATTTNGATTLSTVEDGGGTAAHLTLDVAGDIEINADGGDITFKDDTTILGSWDSSGNLLVKGDLIIDDGGSIKEAGGTAAITIDAAGEVSKIGQDSPSDGEVLTWDNSNSKVVWASAGGGGGTTTRYDSFSVGGLTSYLSSTTNYYFNYYAGYYYWSASDSSPQTLSYSLAAAFQWVAPETCTLEELVLTSRVTSTDDFSVYVYAYPLANNTTLWELSDLNGHLVGSITGISPTSASKVRRIKKTFTANNQIVKGSGLICMLKKDAHSATQRHYIGMSPRVKYQWQNQKSALFNGTDQAFYLDQHANLLAAGYPDSDMTFSAWINADDISVDGATRAIWAWGGYGDTEGKNHRMSCSIKNRRLRHFGEYGSGTNDDHSSDTDLNADTWYHVAVTLSGTTLKFYVNGSADGDATLAGTPTGGDDAGGTQMKATIGASGVATSGGGLSSYFDGHIHNLAIYVGRALSASAIAAIYNSGTPTDLKEIATNYVQADIDALMLWFTFDEVSGGEVVDRANGLVTATNENTVTTESVVPS